MLSVVKAMKRRDGGSTSNPGSGTYLTPRCPLGELGLVLGKPMMGITEKATLLVAKAVKRSD